MSEILSQEEMSSLVGVFNEMGIGEEAQNKVAPSKRIKSYDFARPDMLEKNQLRSLHSVHLKYADKISETISSAIQLPVKTSLIGIDQHCFRDYVLSLSEEMISTQVTIIENMPCALVDISLPFATACVDALTGGDGIAFESVSEMTEIDIAILRRVVSKLADYYLSVWGNQPPHKENASCELNMNSTRNEYLPNESVIAISFEVRAGSIPGIIHICLPYSTVQKLLPGAKKSEVVIAPPVSGSPEITAIMQDSLQEVAIECKAVLGRTTLSTQDIIQLQQGDIIRLDDHVNSEVEFWVGEKLAYSGTPGHTGSNVGLRITRKND